MKNRISLGTAFVVAATIASPTMAELTANIAASSNYLFRGVTQTNDEAAVSGGIDYSNDSGLYAGVWTSNVAIGRHGTGTGQEVDLYFGYAGQAGDVEYDAGYIYYAYPAMSSTGVDYGEVNVNASAGMISGGLAYTVNAGDDNDGGTNDSGDIYGYAAVGGELEQDWSWAVTVGRYEFTNDGDAGVGDVSYTHYQGDLTKSVGDMGDFTLTLSGTDGSDFAGNDPELVVGWAKSF